MRVTLMQVRILLGALKMADVQIRTRGRCRNLESRTGRSSPTAEAAVSRTASVQVQILPAASNETCRVRLANRTAEVLYE